MLFISHSREVGGAEVYLENVLRHLAGRRANPGWQPQLVCRHDEALDSWVTGIAPFCDVVRLDVVRPLDMLRLARLVRQAALVHLNLSFPAGKYQFVCALLTRLLARPLLVTHHLALQVSFPWHQAMRWLGGAARRHIAVSGYSRSVLIEEFGYPPDRVVVVYNGIDAERFRPATEAARKALRHKRGEVLDGQPWGEDELLACTVARLSPQKGLFELVEAIALVVKEMPAVRAVVIGEGDLRRDLYDDVRARGLQHHFFLLGALPRHQVADWLAAADLFILPSHYEGGPATAVMEAMASGCPVVATAVSGVDELINDPSLGRLVPPRNPAALSEAMVDLFADPNARGRIAEHARRRVVADFNLNACLRRTVAVLEEALARDHG